MREYSSQFVAGHFYHVYNRAIGSELLFKNDENYHFFLQKWSQYLDEYVEVWVYCLIPNHFHFLIKVKDSDHLSKFCKSEKTESELILNQFRKLFISYTKSFNKYYDRTGSLFQKKFKRVQVDSKHYLKHLIHYIHHNPIHHHLTNRYYGWKFSSYNSLVSQCASKVKRQQVINFFGNKQSFIDYHNKRKNYNKINRLLLE
ncbi:transposase [Aliifodinibius halophilus]|uniref:Transposase n=1 Tax=Fodinibius halophilus TaxID=1736908 RepID=A0A6M1T8P8_9BACT|nr:transposase [Fodinibius halophilus]